VEVISGIGIFHMLFRLKQQSNPDRDKFEKTALQITGYSFLVLCVGLIFSIVYNIITSHRPETTFWGIVISFISLITMGTLIHYKRKVGIALNSKAILADANCTKTCLYLSIVLLISSLSYQITGLAGIDSIGASLIAYFSFKEGKEALENAATGKHCCCDDDGCKQ
jgi:divalent metal cation (Fe/Co/Zn/Cd) transporter